jgi:ubiquinol-cytochrome c reductase cytochrome c subunit
MPVFSDHVLTPEDKADVIAYLKKTEKTPGYGGFSMGALGPVSEGLFAWLVGIGVLVGFAVWIAAHTARIKKTGEDA